MKNLLFTILGVLTLFACEQDAPGCTDSTSINYNSEATIDDGSCQNFVGKWNVISMILTEENEEVDIIIGDEDFNLEDIEFEFMESGDFSFKAISYEEHNDWVPEALVFIGTWDLQGQGKVFMDWETLNGDEWNLEDLYTFSFLGTKEVTLSVIQRKDFGFRRIELIK